jgi:hypothetical protein
MKVALVLFLVSAAAHAKTEGGELGNAFVPFDSKIGRYSLEYSKDWRVNDLSQSTSFADTKSVSAAESFLAVTVDGAGARTADELLARLRSTHAGTDWQKVVVGGIGGFTGEENGVRMYYLLRGAGDEVSLRMRSSDGGRSDEILAHMLGSFRVE